MCTELFVQRINGESRRHRAAGEVGRSGEQEGNWNVVQLPSRVAGLPRLNSNGRVSLNGIPA